MRCLLCGRRRYVGACRIIAHISCWWIKLKWKPPLAIFCWCFANALGATQRRRFVLFKQFTVGSSYAGAYIHQLQIDRYRYELREREEEGNTSCSGGRVKGIRMFRLHSLHIFQHFLYIIHTSQTHMHTPHTRARTHTYFVNISGKWGHMKIGSEKQKLK